MVRPKLSQALAALLLVVPSAAFAGQAQPPSIDLLGWFSNEISNLMTARAGFLLPIGWEEFVLFSGYALTYFLIKTALAGRYHGIFDLAGFVLLLGRMFFVVIFLSCYMTPLGGSGVTLAMLPITIARGISSQITDGMLDPLIQQIRDVMTGVEKPGLTNLLNIVVYAVTIAEMSVVSIGLFIINAYAYFAYGLCALFGPILIPLLLTKNFAGKFFRWIDASFKYAMLTPVCSAFTFVWSAFILKFFSSAVHGDYSLAHLLGLTALILTMVVSFIYMALKLPAFAGELFGGGGEGFSGVAGDMANFTRNIVRVRR